MKNNFIYLIISAFLLLFSSCTEDNNDLGGYRQVSDIITIDELRLVYQGVDLPLNARSLHNMKHTTGVVIMSPKGGNNINSNEIIIQANDSKSINKTDRSIGITLAVGDNVASTMELGDSLVINLIGSTIIEDEGRLKVIDLPAQNIRKAMTGCIVTPRVVALKTIYDNFDTYEDMLVSIFADISPMPISGEPLAGFKPMPAGINQSGEAQILYLHTKSDASFATKSTMPSSDVIGVVRLIDDKRTVNMRIVEDMQNASGPLYANFPEDFEFPIIKNGGVSDDLTLANSGTNSGTLKTGKWLLYQSFLVDPTLANTVDRERILGKQGIRTERVTNDDEVNVAMLFDLQHGATKITFTYAMHFTDAQKEFYAQISKDGGTTWENLGDPIKATYEIQTMVYMVEIDGAFRFRIHKPGTMTEDGRLNIDNIYIYQKTW